MKIFNNINSFFYDRSDIFNIKSYNQLLIFKIISFITIGFLLIYGINEFLTNQEGFLLVSYFTATGLILVNLILVSIKETRFNLAKNIFLSIITVFFLVILLGGEVGEEDILFYSIFPIFAVLFANKRGNLLSSLFLIATLIILFFPTPELYQTSFDITYKILFIAAYISSFLLILLLKETIQKLINNYKEEIAQIQDELKDKGEFIVNVSHQIRTPLNNIVVVSNMIDPAELDEKHKDYFDTILASTNNIVDVVNSFSDVTNVDIQEREKYEIKFGLSNTIQNTINLFSDKESSEGKEELFTIESNVDSQLIGDPVKIKQVFLNLTEQILKHSDDSKRKIKIILNQEEVDEKKININFKIATQGLSELISKIKAKHHKQQNEQIINKLEINIAQRTIRSLGGALDISPEGEEQIFSFNLEFSKVEEPADQLQTDTQKQAPVEGQKPSINIEDANVLLVEDNLINQKIVLLSLKKAVKNVDVANNGKEALDKFGSVKYDIILMDIQMPVMDGIVTTKKIRNIEKSTNTHTPIIAITAYALLGDKEECIAAGTDDYISKPFQIETLMDKMKGLLEK